MQYELWARNRETKAYEKLQIFYDKIQRDYLLENVDRDTYDEAMVLISEWQKPLALDTYLDFNSEYYKARRR